MVKTHAVYIALVALLLFFGHIWLSEHDARVQAENTIKGLKSQIVTTDKQTAQTVQTVRTIVLKTKTPAQVIAAIPELTDVPLNARPGPTPSTVVVDSSALLTVVADLKITTTQLAGCQSDYKAEQEMVVALKKKPKFWKRIESKLTGGTIIIAAFEVVRIVLTKHP